ncbi:unnamed protein product, partial [Laminaria digitata]
GIAEKTTFGIATALFDGTAGASGVATPTTATWGRRSVFSRSDYSIHLSIGTAGGGCLLESPHHHRSFWAAGTSLLGSLGITLLGLLEHRFWGRRTSSSRLGLRRNVTSGVAERHHHLDRQEDICIAWGRTER